MFEGVEPVGVPGADPDPPLALVPQAVETRRTRETMHIVHKRSRYFRFREIKIQGRNANAMAMVCGQRMAALVLTPVAIVTVAVMEALPVSVAPAASPDVQVAFCGRPEQLTCTGPLEPSTEVICTW